MATIGSIAIAFDAETGGLTSGVDTVTSSLEGIRGAVEALRTQLSGLSSLSVSLTIDTAGIDAATKSVASLKTAAESTSVDVKVSADTAAVAAAASEVEQLGEAIGGTGAAAVQARSSLGSLAVGTAVVITSVRQAIAAYADFRKGFLEFVRSAVGASESLDAGRVAGGAYRATLRGLGGDVAALRAVFGGLKAGVDEMVSGFLSASNINAVLQATLGGVLRLFGVTDDAIVRSVGVISDLVTRQISLAASHRLVQRSLQVISGAYDESTAAIARFLTETAAGRAVADGLARGVVATVSAVSSIDSAVGLAVTTIRSYITSTDLMARVSAAVGTAFDEVAAAARGLVGGTATLGEAFAAAQLRLGILYEGLVRLLPSFGNVSARVSETVSAMARLAPQAGAVAAALGRVFDVLTIVSAAASRTATLLDFSAAVARTAAVSVAVGGLAGAVTGAVAGTGALAGAAGGASTAIAALGTTLPIAAAFAIAAAVATGRFSDALAGLASQAGQLGDLSDRFGQSVQEMQKLKIAADNTNTAFAAVVRGQQTFSSNAEKVKIGQLGTPQAREAAAAFARLGISVEDLRSKSPETLFTDVAREVSKIPDASKRTQVAMDLFGRTGPALLPLLKNIEAINADMERLGGTIQDVDFERLTNLDRSFQRVGTASKSLSQTMLIPFTRMQQAVNNLSADVSGGLSKALSAAGQALAEISTPIAVVVEIIGRMANIVLRIVGIFAELATALGVFSLVAAVFEGIRAGFETAMAPIEEMITAIESVARAIADFLGPTVGLFGLLGQGIGLVVGALGQLLTYVLLGAAAWAIYSVAAAVASGMLGALTLSAITATVAVIGLWIAALGPIALVVGGLALVGVGITLLIGGITSLIGWMFDFGDSAKEIDGATASADELAAAVAETEASSIKNQLEEAMLATGEAAGEAANKIGETIGLSQERVDALKGTIGATVVAAAGLVGFDLSGKDEENQFDKARESIAGARGEMAEFSIRAAQLGQAGAEAIGASSEEFNELQRNLASGKIGLDEFSAGYDEISENLGKTLESIEEGSPEQTLQKNLEVFKQLDDAAKNVAASVRDIGAGVQIGDKFFPRSAEVKARAQEYADEYTDALDGIKRKLATGGFQADLDTRRAENEQAFATGEIDSQTFNRTKRELDTTSAQEQASIAAQDVQRELDRSNAKLKVELDFADNIRKSLETAFLSPVEKFQKELDKIRTNPELTSEEKGLAEEDLRANAREGLIGQTPVEKFSDRQRDLQQGALSGLVSNEEMRNEMLKNADDLARALGVPVNPANQMEVAISQLDTALKAGKISVEQHSDGLKAAQRSFLESIGIKTAAEDIDADKLSELDRQLANKKISKEQFEQGRQGIENDIIGQSASDRIAEDRRRISAGIQSGAVGGARGEASLRSLDADRRSAAGIDNTPSQQIQLGVDKISDAFGVAGKTIQEIQAKLSPEEFAEYQKAIKENREGVLAGLGVQKAGIVQLQELEKNLIDAGATAGETAQAMRKGTDSFLQSLGIEKTPFENFSSSLDNIAEQFNMAGVPLDQVRERLKGNAEQLAQFDRAVKASRDSLLASLGVEKSPQQVFAESMEKIDEAANATDPNKRITREEANQARTEATRKRDEALGAGDNANQFGADFVKRKKEIEEAFGVDGGKDPKKFALAMEELNKSIPGADQSSPLVKFQNELAKLEQVKSIIGEDAFNENKLGLQAELQENLKPALDSVAPDRRLASGADNRSKAGVDTFFRILQGRDNPSLKAQRDTARNTQILADAQNQPEARAVLFQLTAR